jgi:ubiquinone/menaquinone biosynthesis C-methylase UbiE
MHAPSSGWDAVADWYDRLVGESGHDYHRHVIVPCALRMLAMQPGESLADVCCGQGVLIRPMLASGVSRYLGVDASEKLIASARQRHGGDSPVRLMAADASVEGAWADGSYDASVCLMAVHDVADLDGLFLNMARSLKQGGRAVIVMMHPCFRIPKRTHWGFDNEQKIQYRRMDRYATSEEIPVMTHPSRPKDGTTVFHHRPLAPLITALGAAGLAVQACEEPVSHRRSQGGGPFSRAEHKAAEEFPLFLALKAVRIG